MLKIIVFTGVGDWTECIKTIHFSLLVGWILKYLIALAQNISYLLQESYLQR